MCATFITILVHHKSTNEPWELMNETDGPEPNDVTLFPDIH